MKPLETSQCIDIIRAYHWPDGFHCPKCGATHLRKIGQNHEVQQFICMGCNKRFGELAGTFMHWSQIHIRTWFAILLFHAQGRRPCEIRRLLIQSIDVTVAYKTVHSLITTALATPLGQRILQDFSTQHLAITTHNEQTHHQQVQYYAARILWPPDHPKPAPPAWASQAQAPPQQ